MSTSVLGKQFKETGTDFGIPKKPSKQLADAVYDQLSEDYPKKALDWVHSVKWRGPVEVPLSRVDFDDKHSWRAAKEPGKVKKFEGFIKKAERKGEHIKPGILIKRPGEKTDMIPDGHHRALAYANLGKPLYAWEGMPSKDSGPWDSLHDYQFKKDSGPQRQGNKGENTYR